MDTAQRLLRILNDTGPRKLPVLEALAKNRADFERSIGKLFLDGRVFFIGTKRGRLLTSKSWNKRKAGVAPKGCKRSHEPSEGPCCQTCRQLPAHMRGLLKAISIGL